MWKVLHCQQQYFTCYWASSKGLPAAPTEPSYGTSTHMLNSKTLINSTELTNLFYVTHSSRHSLCVLCCRHPPFKNISSFCRWPEKCNTHYSGHSGAAPGERPPTCGQTGGFSAADLRPQHLPGDLQTQHHGPAVGKSHTHTQRIADSTLRVDCGAYAQSPSNFYPPLCRIYSLNTPGIISCTCKWSCVWRPLWTTPPTRTSKTQACRTTRRGQSQVQAAQWRRKHLVRTTRTQQLHPFKMLLSPM